MRLPAEEPPEEQLGALLALTGTELEVLEAAHLSGLIGSQPPVVGEEAAEAGWVEAIRSLTARGLVTRDGRIADGTPAGQVTQTVLDVRLGAGTVVVVERLLGDPEHPRDLRLLHLLPVGAVIEDVHPDGIHGFDLLLGPDQLAGAVTDLLVPPGVDGGSPGRRRDGSVGPVVVNPEEVDLLPARLGHPTVLAELTLLRDGDRVEGHLVALGPAGCWAAARQQGPARFDPVTADWLRSLVSAWVEGVGGGSPTG